ncbi:hypothetical protein GCM10018962_92910 [Dactylosporangium matsuzakiense]|uniref:Uncharacterized protein n=1 Tax=Dactylosporangium matsuzakiense TaxID=53360 RepID=A0A9W6KMH2_9ACTN|nr:hypothetical protein GCM10017581_037760 [Dactylosporangium matsuzakiense]
MRVAGRIRAQVRFRVRVGGVLCLRAGGLPRPRAGDVPRPRGWGAVSVLEVSGRDRGVGAGAGGGVGVARVLAKGVNRGKLGDLGRENVGAGSFLRTVAGLAQWLAGIRCASEPSNPA